MEKLRVRIVKDYDPQNPFLNWDCEPNLVWEFDRDIKGNLEQVKDAIYKAWDGELNTEELSEILEVHKENFDDTEEILDSTVKLFNAWAWGDVFGYILEEKKRFTKIYEDGTTEEDFVWEQIDSCYGFYGYDWETNGMKEYLPQEVHDQLRYIEVEY